MASTDMNQKPWPLLLVSARSAVFFIGLAGLIFWVYLTNSGAVYDSSEDEGLASLQVFFYLALAIHMTSSASAAWALIIWTKVPRYPAFVAVGLTFALLTIPLMYYLTWIHVCSIGVSLPIPGVPVECGD